MLQKRILPKAAYQILEIDETEYSKIVWERKETLEDMEKLLDEGCTETVALEVMKISRASYYRWKKNYKEFGLAGLENESRRPKKVHQSRWSNEIEKRVYHLRKQNPVYGKAKIAVIYKRIYQEKISVSTVGRILKKLIQQTKILPVRFICGKKDTKNRKFNGHAQRWKKDMKAKQPGELIQFDHMTIQVPGHGYLKHFSAICPTTKIAVQRFYQEATSRNAADFLKFVRKEFPFEIISIQVDGGSEFMAEFELSCKDFNIPLYVLPPRSPEYNCNVERSNGTLKYEFYGLYNGQIGLHNLQKALQRFTFNYNKKQPHQGLGYLTPYEFYEEINKEAQSHML